MPDEALVARLLHAEQLAGNPGRERIVALLADGDLAVALRDEGGMQASTEFSFNIGEAMRIARLAFGGDRRAITTPGLSRILCATIIALSRAALLAGLLETREVCDECEDKP